MVDSLGSLCRLTKIKLTGSPPPAIAKYSNAWLSRHVHFGKHHRTLFRYRSNTQTREMCTGMGVSKAPLRGAHGSAKSIGGILPFNRRFPRQSKVRAQSALLLSEGWRAGGRSPVRACRYS